MATPSTSKKIQRVQRAGVSRRPGTRRPVGLPLAVAAILVLGVGSVFYARNARVDAVNAAPLVNDDSWRAAFGVYVCGEWFTNFATVGGDDANADANPDTTGISSAGDGIISIAPKTTSAAGQNARMGLFLKAAGIDAADGEFTLPGDESYADGDKCEPKDGDGKVKGHVEFFVWPPQANENVEPETASGDPNDVRFERDGQIFALAFVPDDLDVEDMPLPPTVSKLSEEEGDAEGDGSTTTAPAEGDGSTTTAPAEGDGSTTTAPAEGDGSTTTAPAEGDGSTTTAPAEGDGSTTTTKAN